MAVSPTIAFVGAALCILLASTVHQIEQGYVGVYYRVSKPRLSIFCQEQPLEFTGLLTRVLFCAGWRAALIDQRAWIPRDDALCNLSAQNSSHHADG
jgi:hypothetical protein